MKNKFLFSDCHFFYIFSGKKTTESPITEATVDFEIHDTVQTSETMDDNVEQRFKLRWHGSTLMLASFVSDSREIEVHGHCFRKGEAKFLIVSCFPNRLNKW